MREAYCCSQRVDGVSESKAPHLLNINVVVEMDQVSLLLLSLNLTPRKGRRQSFDGVAGGGGGGTSRLRGGQRAAGANRNWTIVSISWGGLHRSRISHLKLKLLFKICVSPESWLISAVESVFLVPLLPDWCFLLPEINTHRYTWYTQNHIRVNFIDKSLWVAHFIINGALKLLLSEIYKTELDVWCSLISHCCRPAAEYGSTSLCSGRICLLWSPGSRKTTLIYLKRFQKHQLFPHTPLTWCKLHTSGVGPDVGPSSGRCSEPENIQNTSRSSSSTLQKCPVWHTDLWGARWPCGTAASVDKWRVSASQDTSGWFDLESELDKRILTFLKKSDREPFLRGLMGLVAALVTADWTAIVPVRVWAGNVWSVAPPCPDTLTWSGIRVIPPLSLAIPACVRGWGNTLFHKTKTGWLWNWANSLIYLLFLNFCEHFQNMCLPPCIGMVSVCPLSAVMVAAPTVTTPCLAVMAVMRPGWSTLVRVAGAGPAVLTPFLVVVPGWLSCCSTNSRRRKGPTGGEL